MLLEDLVGKQTWSSLMVSSSLCSAVYCVCDGCKMGEMIWIMSLSMSMPFFRMSLEVVVGGMVWDWKTSITTSSQVPTCLYGNDENVWFTWREFLCDWLKSHYLSPFTLYKDKKNLQISLPFYRDKRWVSSSGSDSIYTAGVLYSVFSLGSWPISSARSLHCHVA